VITTRAKDPEPDPNEWKDELCSAFTKASASQATLAVRVQDRLTTTFFIYNGPHNKPRRVARFALRRVNDAVILSCHLWIAPSLRGKGLSHAIDKARLAVARQMGCTTLIATVHTDNEIQLRAMRNRGWITAGTIPGVKAPWIYLMYRQITTTATTKSSRVDI